MGCKSFRDRWLAAERALLNDLKILDKWEANHIEGRHFRIDYPGCKALDHEGLFLIYRYARETNKMELEFQRSIDCLSQSCRSQGLPALPSVSYDEFAREIEMREHKIDVRWKTNDFIAPNNR